MRSGSESVVKSDVGVSGVIPVYNEEGSIAGVIKEVQESLSKLNLKYEIIVVDDGSNDGSEEILRGMEGIGYIRHPTNTGYGGALKSGIKKAKGEVIVITDGDGSYPNEVIPALVKEMAEYDMVVGARAQGDPNIPFIRKPVKWILGKLANYLSGTKIPDLNSGLRAFRREDVLRFFNILPSGFSFTTTITLAMLCNGYSVSYVPVEYRARHGKSKISPIRDTVNFLQLIFRTIMYFNPLKIFLPISGLVFIIFVLCLLNDLFVLDDLTDKTIMSFVGWVQVLMIGLLADLVDKRSG
jgi:glycosyltransferase involved in cell wall biosynthesis